MFSSLKQRLGTRVLDRLDLVVEFATLGGYGVDRDRAFALESPTPERGVRALAFAGEGVVTTARAGATAGARATTGQAWGDRARGDCPPAGALRRLCRGGAARP